MTTPAMPDSQECKRRAIRALARSEELDQDNVLGLQLLFQVAQVWATLATAPEPVEYSTAELISAPALGAQFPTLVCPHGMVARLIPLGSEKVDGVDFPTSLRYSWTDCEICS